MALGVERTRCSSGWATSSSLSGSTASSVSSPSSASRSSAIAGERAAAAEVAARDQLLLRVAGQPRAAGAEQLVDLVAGLPVVLGLVEDRQQDVELVERVGQPDRAAQGQVQVARVTPLRELLVQRDRRRLHLPPERLEDPEGEADAAAAGQHRDHDLERDRSVGQLLAAVAAPARAVLNTSAMRGAEQARGGVRAVVDVLRQAEVRAALAARASQPDRVDVEGEQHVQRSSVASG